MSQDFTFHFMKRKQENSKETLWWAERCYLNFPLLCIEIDVFELWFWGISCNPFALIAEGHQDAWSLAMFIFYFLKSNWKVYFPYAGFTCLSLGSKNKMYFWECIGFQRGHLHVSSHVCSAPTGLTSWALWQQRGELPSSEMGTKLLHLQVYGDWSLSLFLMLPCSCKLCSTREREIKWEGARGCFCTFVTDFVSISWEVIAWQLRKSACV